MKAIGAGKSKRRRGGGEIQGWGQPRQFRPWHHHHNTSGAITIITIAPHI